MKEPKILLGRLVQGILIVSEQFSEFNGESFAEYECLRKIVFPKSLRKLDSYVIEDMEELEEIDFSKVTMLKEIPEDFISGKTKIKSLIIPNGVTTVGDCFLGDTTSIRELYVPSSVEEIGAINGEGENSVDVYLFASGIDLEEIETDVRTLYVLPDDYAEYARKLKEYSSEVKLRTMPADRMNIYVSFPGSQQSMQEDNYYGNADEMANVPPPPPNKIREKQVKNKTNSASSFEERATVESGIIPEELDLLIQTYLTDGILTDKEREVILRKAEKLGLDRDEIDLYLDAQVQKIEQALDKVNRMRKGKTCPYCGGGIPQLTDKCPHCGENITMEASADLKALVDSLEEALINMKSGRDISWSKAMVESNVRKAKLYYGNNPKIQKLIPEIESELLIAATKLKRQKYINLLKNGYFWAGVMVLIGVISGFIIGIKKSESAISLMLIIGGAIVAMNTSMNREDKKNN